MTVILPDDVRALAFVAGEAFESGRNFMSGCFDLNASLAIKKDKSKYNFAFFCLTSETRVLINHNTVRESFKTTIL